MGCVISGRKRVKGYILCEQETRFNEYLLGAILSPVLEGATHYMTQMKLVLSHVINVELHQINVAGNNLLTRLFT